MTVYLTDYDMEQCKLFAREAARTGTHEQNEFGNWNTIRRSPDRMYQDILTGKLAEVAVARWMYSGYGVKVPTNFEQIPLGDCDNEDFQVNGWALDIKCTKTGRWLLFEKHKAEYRKRTGTAPDFVIMCREKHKAIEIVGGISFRHLTAPDGERVRFIRKGEQIPGTTTRLKADNYAVPFERLGDPDRILRWTAENRRTV
jgi:hypothetical protein